HLVPAAGDQKTWAGPGRILSCSWAGGVKRVAWVRNPRHVPASGRRGIGVTTAAARTGDDLQRQVLEEVRWGHRVRPHEGGVSVTDGIVTLTGWVDSFTKKWVAERVAHRVRGVKAVANDIEVRLPGSAERTDADIAAAATRALEWDAQVPTDKVKVTVSKGWVTLEGEGEWEDQRRGAERAGGGASGGR